LVLLSVVKHNKPSSENARLCHWLQVCAKPSRLTHRIRQSRVEQFQKVKSGVTVNQLRWFGIVPAEREKQANREVQASSMNGQCHLSHNKSLKAARVARWTVQTGAASHYRAGSACPLARRYV